MTTVSCSSCSATPTPASLVADEVKKGELGKSRNGSGVTSASNHNSLGNSDTVQISTAAQQRLSLEQQGTPPTTATSKIEDTYSKPVKPQSA